MTAESGTAGPAATGGAIGRPASPAPSHGSSHVPSPGGGCLNCGTALRGHWCHACGQAVHATHRSLRHLAMEAVEGLVHADGRLVRTLPRLVLNPGRLTREYLAGRRASQLPPFQLFLVMLLVLFLAGGHPHVDGGPDEADRRQAKAAIEHLPVGAGMPAGVETWLRARLPRAIDRPDELVGAMLEWAHRFAFLALPISALLLAVLFVFRRGLTLYDHLIFSLHSLSFQGFLLSLVLATAGVAPTGVLLAASPVHLFAHLRGVYGGGVVATLLRMAVLALLSVIGFALLLAGLVLVGLNALR